MLFPFKPIPTPFMPTGDVAVPPGETPFDASEPSVTAADAVPNDDDDDEDVGELLRFRLLPPTLEFALPPLR